MVEKGNKKFGNTVIYLRSSNVEHLAFVESHSKGILSYMKIEAAVTTIHHIENSSETTPRTAIY
jgi:hypothetical protein